MTEQKLEQRIIDALRARVPGARIRGAWTDTTEHGARGLAETVGETDILVSVAPRRFESYGFCKVSFACAVAVEKRTDNESGRAEVVGTAEPVADLLTRWQLDEDGATRADLTPDDGSFSADAFSLDSGDSPDFDEDSGIWRAAFNFTVTGTLAHHSH